MAAVKEVRGPLWVDGQFTVRVRSPGLEPVRAFRFHRPFALIGRIPGADLRIDDPAVDDRHTFLILDHRGLFSVDLLSRTGTRFGDPSAASAWLGPGDAFEIAGRRIEIIQLCVNNSNIDPSPSNHDPFAEVHASKLAALTLEPLDTSGPPWMLGSALAFVGQGDACVIKVDDPSVAPIHCALHRFESDVYVIDLLGRRTLINDRPLEQDGASKLVNGDTLTIGRSRFLVKVDSSSYRDISDSPSKELVLAPRESRLALILNAVETNRETSDHQVLEVLRQFQSDTATLLEAQIERIEALNREIASLRDEVRDARGPTTPPATPLRLDLTPPPMATTDESATWLLDRLSTLETESRSTWKNLLGRIAPSPTSTAPTLASAHPETGRRR